MNRKSPSKYTHNNQLNPFIPSREIPYDRNSSNTQIISPSNDIPIINEILEKNDQFCEVMKKRVTKIYLIFIKKMNMMIQLFKYLCVKI